MKKKSASQSAFFNLRVLFGTSLVLAGVFLGALGFGQFSAQAQPRNNASRNSIDPLVPAGFDCARIRELGVDRQENLRAGAIMIFCGEALGGSPAASGESSPIVQEMLAPLLGAADVNLITGTESFPNVTQSETFTAVNPDDPTQIVVAYNDSRGRNANPINISGASVSLDGGNTFTRLQATSGQSPFPNTVGDPVVLYNKALGTWFTVWLDVASGGQGLGGFKTTTPANPNSWTHFTVHSNSADDRESGWVDNNPSSPHFGRMYVSWNDFNIGGGAIFVSFSDNGTSWTKVQVNSSFVRNVQITGDSVTGDVYIAGMNENGGGFPHNCNNLIFKSTNGGATWTNPYTGPTFSGPGRSASGYFATMYASPAYWRHEGWGQPAARNGIVHYVYAARNAGNGDAGDVFYIRSADGGVTFSAPFMLNTNTDPSKAQWQPNLSAAGDGSLLSVWYDERERVASSCQPSSPGTPCYRMWARKSTDGGLTWAPDEPFSDVVTPLPLQPDPGIQSVYAGDYDYSSAVQALHSHSWVDGRNIISGQSQQDAYHDREGGGGGGGTPNLVSAASRVTQGGAGPFDIDMPLAGTSGVDDRVASTYTAVFNFDGPVTSGDVMVVSGTAMAGAASFSGNTMTVPLTGVANIQVVTLRVENINGSGTPSGDVPFGFLIADVDSSRMVDKTDFNVVKAAVGQPVDGGNFRDDIDANGSIDRADALQVKTHKKQHL